jgi:hypothetical protein
MTEDELEWIEYEHRRSEGSLLFYDTALCAACSEPWPCLAVRLLAEVRRLRALLEEREQRDDDAFVWRTSND